MKPSIGRIVHFYLGNSKEPLPAIITRVWTDTTVNLVVFGIHHAPSAEYTSIVYSEQPEENTLSWCWPPKV